MVFVDADFFIGLYYIKDCHHDNCLRLSDYFTDEQMITSWDVIDEVSTKLTYFTDKNLSLRFLKRIFDDKYIFVIFPDHGLVDAARKIFEGQRSHMVSMTDCMNMAIAREKGVSEFLSFDKIYEKNGFKLIR